MRFLFMCGSLEPGRDGVGDYTQILATHLCGEGHQVVCVALNDRHISELVTGNSGQFALLRLPANIAWTNRFVILQQEIDDFAPDWISLQFVPYGYHKKGLPWFGFLKGLAGLKGAFNWHLMFHELWIGVNSSVKPRERPVQFLQRVLISRLIRLLRPRSITSTIPLYKKALQLPGVRILPLYGNIAIKSEPLQQVVNPNAMSALHFGTFSGNLKDLEQQFMFVKQLAKKEAKEAEFYVIGGAGPYKEGALALARTIFLEANVHFIGKLPATEISNYMLQSSVGISRADFSMYGKSGSTIAMLEHGMPVILRGSPPADPGLEEDGNAYFGQLLFTTAQPVSLPCRKAPDTFRKKEITQKFLSYLN